MTSRISGAFVAAILFSVCWCQSPKNGRHGVAETNDNEFAEFEDPDEYTPKIHQQQKEQQQKEKQQQLHQEQQKAAAEREESEKEGQQPPHPTTPPSEQPATTPDEASRQTQTEDKDDEARVDSAEDDDFSHLRDTDEFENFDPGKHGGIGKRGGAEGEAGPSLEGSGGSAGPGKGEPTLKFTSVPQHLTTNWESFYVEMLMIGGLLVYFLNFLIGKSKNTRLVNAWLSSHKELLENNFAVVGDDGKSKEAPSGVGELQRDAEHVYSLWCSGRVACEGMLVELKMVKRQDIVNVIARMMKPTYDQVIVKVVMEETEMDSFVLAVSNRKRVNGLMKDYQDIATFCKEGRKSMSRFGVSDNFVLLSECGEAAEAILDHRVIATLRRFEEQIEYIHISDQFSGPKLPNQDESQTKLPEIKKCILFGFKVGKKGMTNAADMANLRPLFDLVIYLIDKVKRVRLGKEAKVKAEKNRRRAGESIQKMVHSQRQEAAQQRREEKRRAEKERLLNEEDPEKARKLEERENKRELKRKQAKTKMLKIKGK